MVRRPFIFFKNKYFVESGSYYGDGIQDALNAGFSIIHSYEVLLENYHICANRFAHNSNVNLHYKSSTQMYDEISKINEPITFWLDGHYSGNTTGYDDNEFYPLRKELDIISRHPIKTHTICIDDRRLLIETDDRIPTSIGFSEKDIIQDLLKINPNYTIDFLDNFMEKDVIVAHI